MERSLNSSATKSAHPAIGSDVKVMGVRNRDRIKLTVGCAFVGRHLASVDDYVRAKDAVASIAIEAARQTSPLEVEVVVNGADDMAQGDIFLTVTGTSAEAGDDGEVGRGNRANGLVTPYRLMTMEAAAGKNPVSHVGKLYSLLAGRAAEALVAEVRRGRRHLRVRKSDRTTDFGPPIGRRRLDDARRRRRRSDHRLGPRNIAAELGRVAELRQALLDERVTVY